MSDELKACPFCGSHDVEVQGKPAILDALDSVCCNECSADAPYPVWNTRAQIPSQGGEAVEVFTTWHPDSRSYEEQIVKHDTKGSRKALGAMNAKLRAKVGRLERELATVKQSLTVEPVAYAAFADNGNIRMWCHSAIGMCELFDSHGNKAVPLYTHPAGQVADDLTMVKVSRELLDRALSEGIDDLNGKFLAREELRALLEQKP